MLKFVSPLIVVEDMAAPGSSTNNFLEQKVKFDFGVDVAFESGLTIHLKSHFQSLLGDATRYPITLKTHNYDPDGHIIEIGEPMEAAVRRFHRQDWSIERIAEKTGMPHEFIAGAI